MKPASFSPGEEFGPCIPLRSRLLRLYFRMMAWLLFRVRVIGGENLTAQNVIVVSNHLSWIDHLLLWAVLPAEPRLYLLGAIQSDNSPFKDWLFRTFGGIIVFERGANWIGKDTLRRPLRALESGASLLLFPEGDVGPHEGELMPLTRGIGHFVLRAPADCRVLPIALSGVKELYWRKEMSVIVGPPFRVQVEGLTHHAAVAAAVMQVDAALRRLLPVYVEPVVAFKPMRFLTNLSDRL